MPKSRDAKAYFMIATTATILLKPDTLNSASSKKTYHQIDIPRFLCGVCSGKPSRHVACGRQAMSARPSRHGPEGQERAKGSLVTCGGGGVLLGVRGVLRVLRVWDFGAFGVEPTLSGTFGDDSCSSHSRFPGST